MDRARERWLLILLRIAPLCISVGCSTENHPTPTTPEKHELISQIRPGMTEQEARDLLGPPDEVRTITEGRLLDGTRIYSSEDTENGETYRWAYGNRQPGTFARTGIVSFDKAGRVICAQSPVQRISFSPIPPALGDPGKPLESPIGLSCRVDGISSLGEAEGETVRWWSASVTLTNSGKTDFTRRTSIDPSIHRLSTVEVYDSEQSLVSRDDHRTAGSPISFTDTLELSVPAGQSRTEKLNFCTDEYFGPLPPGRYFLRVCFPYTNDKFICSGLKEFQVPEFPEIPGHPQ
jgi:hypothetical protein